MCMKSAKLVKQGKALVVADQKTTNYTHSLGEEAEALRLELQALLPQLPVAWSRPKQNNGFLLPGMPFP